MVEILESTMLLCFGLSWPISVYKSITSRSTRGKSFVFILAILAGYIAGIAGKLIGHNFSFVLILYIINLAFVSADAVIYVINERREDEYEKANSRTNGDL